MNIAPVLRVALSYGIPRRSAKIAIVVGSVLNLINQGDALLAGHGIDPVKALLTYLVPFCVATYGAVTFALRTAALTEGSPRTRPD